MWFDKYIGEHTGLPFHTRVAERLAGDSARCCAADESVVAGGGAVFGSDGSLLVEGGSGWRVEGIALFVDLAGVVAREGCALQDRMSLNVGSL